MGIIFSLLGIKLKQPQKQNEPKIITIENRIKKPYQIVEKETVISKQKLKEYFLNINKSGIYAESPELKKILNMIDIYPVNSETILFILKNYYFNNIDFKFNTESNIVYTSSVSSSSPTSSSSHPTYSFSSSPTYPSSSYPSSSNNISRESLSIHKGGVYKSINNISSYQDSYKNIYEKIEIYLKSEKILINTKKLKNIFNMILNVDINIDVSIEKNDMNYITDFCKVIIGIYAYFYTTQLDYFEASLKKSQQLSDEYFNLFNEILSRTNIFSKDFLQDKDIQNANKSLLFLAIEQFKIIYSNEELNKSILYFIELCLLPSINKINNPFNFKNINELCLYGLVSLFYILKIQYNISENDFKEFYIMSKKTQEIFIKNLILYFKKERIRIRELFAYIFYLKFKITQKTLSLKQIENIIPTTNIENKINFYIEFNNNIKNDKDYFIYNLLILKDNQEYIKNNLLKTEIFQNVNKKKKLIKLQNSIKNIININKENSQDLYKLYNNYFNKKNNNSSYNFNFDIIQSFNNYDLSLIYNVSGIYDFIQRDITNINFNNIQNIFSDIEKSIIHSYLINFCIFIFIFIICQTIEIIIQNQQIKKIQIFLKNNQEIKQIIEVNEALNTEFEKFNNILENENLNKISDSNIGIIKNFLFILFSNREIFGRIFYNQYIFKNLKNLVSILLLNSQNIFMKNIKSFEEKYKKYLPIYEKKIIELKNKTNNKSEIYKSLYTIFKNDTNKNILPIINIYECINNDNDRIIMFDIFKGSDLINLYFGWLNEINYFPIFEENNTKNELILTSYKNTILNNMNEIFNTNHLYFHSLLDFLKKINYNIEYFNLLYEKFFDFYINDEYDKVYLIELNNMNILFLSLFENNQMNNKNQVNNKNWYLFYANYLSILAMLIFKDNNFIFEKKNSYYSNFLNNKFIDINLLNDSIFLNNNLKNNIFTLTYYLNDLL